MHAEVSEDNEAAVSDRVRIRHLFDVAVNMSVIGHHYAYADQVAPAFLAGLVHPNSEVRAAAEKAWNNFRRTVSGKAMAVQLLALEKVRGVVVLLYRVGFPVMVVADVVVCVSCSRASSHCSASLTSAKFKYVTFPLVCVLFVSSCLHCGSCSVEWVFNAQCRSLPQSFSPCTQRSASAALSSPM